MTRAWHPRCIARAATLAEAKYSKGEEMLIQKTRQPHTTQGGADGIPINSLTCGRITRQVSPRFSTSPPERRARHNNGLLGDTGADILLDGASDDDV